MIRLKCFVQWVCLTLPLAISLSMICGRNSLREISDRNEVISCEYIGLAERNGQPVVELIFRNRTGKDLSSVRGGLQIIGQDGEIFQRTGFTYSRPFAAGEEKIIPAFRYLEIKPEAMKVLKSAGDFIPMVFSLDEVIFTDGKSMKFE